MRLSILVFSFLAFSCEDPDDFSGRSTVATIKDELATLKVVYRNVEGKKRYQLYFKLSNNSYSELTPIDSTSLRNFFVKEMELSSPYLHYAGYAYSYYYLEIGQPQEISVRISGDIKKKKPKDDLVGHPFDLTRLEKIRSCPVDYIVSQTNHSLQDRYWRLIGFIDSQNNVTYSPTCEFNKVTINFSSNLLVDDQGYSYPSVNPEARFMNINAGLRSNTSQGTLAYIQIDTDKIITDYYLRLLLNRPCNTCGGITADITKDMMKVQNKLGSLLANKDTITYSIQNNILTMQNKYKNERALFIVN